jgi:hypothetical protein
MSAMLPTIPTRARLLGAAMLATSALACLPSYTVVDGSGGGDAGMTTSTTGAGGSSTDPLNCGAAKHDCQGGKCVGGVCQPFVVADGLASPRGFAVADQQILWIDGDGLWGCPIAGCGPNPKDKTPLAQIGSATSVAVGGDLAYVSDSSVGTLVTCKLPDCTGGLQPFADGLEKPGSLVVHGSELYFSAGMMGEGLVYRCPLAGGCGFGLMAAVPYNSSLLAIRLAISSAGDPYWTTNDSLVASCPYAGCIKSMPQVLATSVLPDALAIQGDRFYFSYEAGGILSCPLTGCSSDSRTVSPGAGVVGDMAADDTYVYWTEPSTKVVRRAPLEPGLSSVIAGAQDQPSRIAVTKTAVYWMNDDVAASGFGSIWRVAK